MERENRFLVIKRADIDKYLTEEEQLKLHTYAAKVDIQRLKQDEKKAKSYVVVAENWPMYEDVWGAIKQYVDTGEYEKNAQLQQQLGKAEAANRGLVEALEYMLRVQVFEADVYYGDACRKAIEALADNPNTERYQAERKVIEAAIDECSVVWPEQGSSYGKLLRAVANLQSLNKDKGE